MASFSPITFGKTTSADVALSALNFAVTVTALGAATLFARPDPVRLSTLKMAGSLLTHRNAPLFATSAPPARNAVVEESQALTPPSVAVAVSRTELSTHRST